MEEKQLSKNERIALRKSQGLIKDRHSRKLEKFSDRFNEMFNFFLISYRKGLLDFGGAYFDIYYDKGSYSGKESFRRFDDGQFTGAALNGKQHMGVPTQQPNILKAVITAKKSWGLHVKMWCEGIAERNFTVEEIVQSFECEGIRIPDFFMKEFDNAAKKASQEWLIN